MERYMELDGAWKLGVIDDAYVPAEEISSFTTDIAGLNVFEAIVPGNYELDMERAGALEDLYFDENLRKSYEMEYNHLFYSKKFTLDEIPDDVDLVFDGIDTIADVYLNGILLGHVDNMFLRWKYDVSSMLQKGENEILVHIRPVSIEARKIDNPFYTYALRYNFDAINIRKSNYMFGWDIFPRIVSGGIWKSVYLEKREKLGFLQSYLFTKRLSDDRSEAVIEWFYELELGREHYRDFDVEISGRCGDSSFCERQKVWSKAGKICDIAVPAPMLWWPRNSGEQNLYECKAVLERNGEVVAEKTFNFGLRTMELDRTDVTDENSSGEFCFKVNGQRIFIMGTNWVPLDSFPSQGRAKLDRAFALVDEAGCNMIRIWGGGYYEDQHLFDLCDENGVLIWQDFMMGCALYPQNEEFLETIRKEATFIVREYRQHCSLAIWAGDNENDVCSGWNGNMIDPTGNKLTRVVLPEVVKMNDFIRDFLPSSPYVSVKSWMLDRGNRTPPEQHLWGPRDYFKGEFYRTATAHFASETGYHGCNSIGSLAKFIRKDRLWPWQENLSWYIHASSPAPEEGGPYNYRIALMANQIKVLFDEEPDELERFVELSQISQAEAVKYFIERFRTGKWKRTGIIWWNILDGCPQISDAVVDYYFEKKKAFDYIKRSQTPVCLMVADDRSTLCMVNEFPCKKSVSWKLKSSNGVIVAEGKDDIDAFGIKDVAPVDKSLSDMYMIEWIVDGETFFNHYAVIEGAIDADGYVASAKRIGVL